jgi:type II secretion system protein G
MSPRSGARRGFTLIELLVVVVIIGILASVALPSFVGAQDKARNATLTSNLNVVRLALETYGTEHNGLFPINADFATANGLCQGNYLPGNKMPLSPWSQLPQTIRIQPTAYPAMCAEWLNDPAFPPPPAGASFSPPLVGAVGAPPTLISHYGAIASDTENVNDRTAYVINAIGKKGRNCVVTGWLTNVGK